MVQGNIDICFNNSKETETVFKNLDAEFKTFMQEQSVDEIPVLKSAVSDNRPLMDPNGITELTELLFDFKKKLRDIVENRFDLSTMSKIFGQVVKEISKIRKTMKSFQYVEVLEGIMKNLKESLMEAQNVIHRKKAIKQQTQRQTVVKSKNSKVVRQQSPLSLMIYSDIYDPLPQKDKSKSKKVSYFNLEDKLNNLDLLEQDVLPTLVKYGPQDSVPQPRNYRKPGELISNTLFDGDDLVDPTLPGVSSRSSR